MHKFPSEVWGDDLAEKLPSPVEQFHDSISKYPDNIALVCTHQDADLYGISGSLDVVSGAKSAPYLRWTFKDLKKGVNRLKGALASLGVQKGTPVVTLLPNCAEFTLTWWAAMELGAVVASLDPRRLSNSSEVAHMLETIIAATNYQRPIIVALNEGYLNTPAILSSVSSPAAILVSTEGASQSYSSFKDIMDQSQRPSGIIDEQFNPNQLSETDCSCILFTSGSTSLPKGVLRSRDHQASFAKDVYKTPGYETLPGDIWCSVTPTNHCVGINGMISPMLVGAGVLFPGESFSAEATAHALIHEKCTHMLLVPTMVSMIADYLTEDTKMRGRTNLKAVMLTGSPPTSENLHTCFDVLGSRGVCIRYGSTEGFACVTEIAANGQELVGEGGRLSVGRPIAGNGVKICRPNEKAQLGLPLPRGTTGEIHCSARWGKRTMYIGKEDTDETCYTDEKGKRWLVTGDQGVMDEQGNLYVTGRLKDMIIRGGENISPAAIEARLAKNPRLGSKPIQIVGQPNPISGEVPIAIIADDPEFKSIVSEIYDTVRDEMGLMWVPHEVISLEQLGLGDWPRTSMGKIHRFTLRELVQKRYQDSLDKQTRKEAAREEVCQTDLTWDEDRVKEEILSIWSSSVGLDQNSLRRDLPISQFADSLSLAQVRGHLRRTIPGLKKLRMLDVSGQDTLSKQIEIITERWRGGTIPDDQEVEAETEGPKGPDDMVHTIARPDLFNSTKKLVTEAIRQSGFQWEDVASIIPAPNFVGEMTREGVFDSGRFDTAFVTNTERSLDRLKLAFKAMLRANSILPSFMVWDKEIPASSTSNIVLHVTLKPTDALYDHVLVDGGSVDTVEDLNALASARPYPDWALPPGILFRVLLLKVKETNTLGFIISVNNAVMDATYTNMFLSNIDQALNGPAPQRLQIHTSYQLWAESYFSFRESPQARASINWHANYLSGIGKHIEKAQWPPIPERGPFDLTGEDKDREFNHSFAVPDLAALRRKHPQISAPVIVKAALALLNVHKTGHDYAVFSNMEAGRTKWPFMPAALTSHPNMGLCDEATDVTGPLSQAVTNLIRISPDESVLEMLGRLQVAQEALTRYAHAPWSAVERALDIAEEADGVQSSVSTHLGLMRSVWTTQLFNWIPGMGAQVDSLKAPFANFRKLRSVSRWHVRLIVRAGLGGANGDTVILSLLGDGLTYAQKEEATQKLETLVRTLTRPENWDAPVLQSML